ncbi:hypothetical protein [uncultured Allobaculum sp.]|uniref:hypothetical protein n=1 Tax=uncultured Allobaculum sp. TaxID=1187017 RepID=UPI002582AAE0|nr:hypothetical protein [uncultured Allobaculum sp.]
MTMIKGMSVTLYERKAAGSDPFGVPIYEETPVKVENVLVAPASSEDVETTTALYGKHARYTLAIPKGDQHAWEDATVEFFGRKWHTIGFVQLGIEENIPLSWHGKISVEAYECA